MLKNKKILAVIPARGGSKRVKGKNIRSFCGLPLIAWTIKAAQKSAYIDRVILSSEDQDIINVAKEHGCDVPFVRPDELSADNVAGVDPIIHAVETVPGYDYVIVLQCTSPMRTARDIDLALEKCIKQDAVSCVSVSPVTCNPNWMFKVDITDHLKPFLAEKLVARSQDQTPLYYLNGAIYVADINWLKVERKLVSDDSLAMVMPEESSFDIDTEKDFIMAEMYMSHFRNNA